MEATGASRGNEVVRGGSWVIIRDGGAVRVALLSVQCVQMNMSVHPRVMAFLGCRWCWCVVYSMVTNLKSGGCCLCARCILRHHFGSGSR
jgi:hypothetical protein